MESRTQNLYTKQLENSIFLCAMSDNGTLAVVTEDQDQHGEAAGIQPLHGAAAQLEHDLQRRHPLRMAFSPDSRKLAAAAVTVSGDR